MNSDTVEIYEISAVLDVAEPQAKLRRQTFWERLRGKPPIVDWQINTVTVTRAVDIMLTAPQAEWVRNHPDIVLTILANGEPYHSPKFFKVVNPGDYV